MIIGGDDLCGAASGSRCIAERYHFSFIEDFMAKHSQETGSSSKLEHSDRAVAGFAIFR